MALLNFDATIVAPDTGFETYPAGWYNVQMTGSELKPTKTEGGIYLACEFTILDGQYAGRKLFAKYNIRNANPTAQEIAYKQLSAVCHAVGVMQVQDSQLLHGKPLKVKVKIRIGNKDPSKGEVYEDQNEITTYRNISDNVEASVGAPTAVGAHAASLQPPPGFAAQPWAQPGAKPGPAIPTGAPFQIPNAVPPAVVLPPPVAPATVAPPPVVLPAIKTMSAKAQGATYEQFIAAGWTDEKMVAEGYLTITQPVAPVVQTPPLTAQPVIPSVSSVGPAATAGASALVPPWLQK